MRINFNSTNFSNNTSFKSKFTENSKKDLHEQAEYDPCDVYATLQMAKNDKKDDVLLLRKSDTLRYGYDFLSFKFDKEKNHYKCCDKVSTDESFLDGLNSLNHSVVNKETDELYNKYEEELIQATNCTKLTKQIDETRKQIDEIEKQLEEHKEKLFDLCQKRDTKLQDYVSKIIDEEATVKGFNGYQWRDGNGPKDYGM